MSRTDWKIFEWFWTRKIARKIYIYIKFKKTERACELTDHYAFRNAEIDMKSKTSGINHKIINSSTESWGNNIITIDLTEQ